MRWTGGATLVLLSVLGLGLRLHYLSQTVRYDEAYTYLRFASNSFPRAMADYAAPNNHLLNTALVWGSTRVFGNKLWALRLPALLVGMLLIPAGYFAARLLYGPEAALLAAGLMATSRYLIEYSANARGYGFVAFFTLVSVIAAGRLGEGRRPWAALVAGAVAGLFSMPTMLYPLGGIGLWIVLERRQSARRLALAALVTGLAAVVLYLPAIVYSGPGALVANRAVRSLAWTQFGPAALKVLRELWSGWNAGLPPWAGVALGVAAVVGLVVHRRPVSPLVPMVVWSVAFCLVLRVVGYGRVWIFLLPLYLAAAAAGLSFLMRRRAAPVAAIVLAVGTAASVMSGRYEFRSTETLPDAEAVLAALQDTVRPGDRIVSRSPVNMVLAYEIRRRYPQLVPGLESRREAPRLLAVVSERVGWEDLAWALHERGELNPAEYGAPRTIAAFGSAAVLEVRRQSQNP